MRCCRRCGRCVPLGKRSLCTRCTNQVRDADPARYLARKLADWLRRRGFKAPYPGVCFVRQVIARCQGKSVLSGAGHLRKLSVVLVDPSAPWVPKNAILVTPGESYALTCCASMEERHRLLKKKSK